MAHPEYIEAAFKMLDKDDNGSISLEELRTMFHASITSEMESELADLMNAIDKDKNGEIDYEEFKDYIVKLAVI